MPVLDPKCSFLMPPFWHGTSPYHKRRRCGGNGSSQRCILQVCRRLAAGRVIEPALAASIGGTRDNIEQARRFGCRFLCCFHIYFSCVISPRLACWPCYHPPLTLLA